MVFAEHLDAAQIGREDHDPSLSDPASIGLPERAPRGFSVPSSGARAGACRQLLMHVLSRRAERQTSGCSLLSSGRHGFVAGILRREGTALLVELLEYPSFDLPMSLSASRWSAISALSQPGVRPDERARGLPESVVASVDVPAFARASPQGRSVITRGATCDSSAKDRSGDLSEDRHDEAEATPLPLPLGQAKPSCKYSVRAVERALVVVHDEGLVWTRLRRTGRSRQAAAGIGLVRRTTYGVQADVGARACPGCWNSVGRATDQHPESEVVAFGVWGRRQEDHNSGCGPERGGPAAVF